ncbi:hypothetical protein [Micromonospora sp. NPDC049282]
MAQFLAERRDAPDDLPPAMRMLRAEASAANNGGTANEYAAGFVTVP